MVHAVTYSGTLREKVKQCLECTSTYQDALSCTRTTKFQLLWFRKVIRFNRKVTWNTNITKFQLLWCRKLKRFNRKVTWNTKITKFMLLWFRKVRMFNMKVTACTKITKFQLLWFKTVIKTKVIVIPGQYPFLSVATFIDTSPDEQYQQQTVFSASLTTGACI